MPATTITLGIGHLPSDHDRKTQLDVHLHLNCPATPISMGERWGPQSIGASFTLQQATENRHEEHLRVCGCDWLCRLALEERMSGHVFTPEEILQRRPEQAAPAAEPKPAPSQSSPEPQLAKIRRALETHDFEKIEGLRDVLNPGLVQQIADDWRSDLPRETKDAYAALLLDQVADCVRPIFEDALASPSVESRAYAVCVLTKDFGRFDSMLVNGGLDAAKVDAAVRTLS
ncbi:hypothetical protein [Prosthecobacter sp.]|uniref:hypothetical protein n=1 Tax=Prosthecobacter sp. TaxID=1965333 RepID=UPI001DB1AD12|nr:hypothetical protein [Prosthecobacter sp.]MCB1277103.1 hypothetical protein [Prosthecobacter sp.]